MPAVDADHRRAGSQHRAERYEMTRLVEQIERRHRLAHLRPDLAAVELRQPLDQPIIGASKIGPSPATLLAGSGKLSIQGARPGWSLGRRQGLGTQVIQIVLAGGAVHRRRCSRRTDIMSVDSEGLSIRAAPPAFEVYAERIVVRLKSAAETLLSRTWSRPDCFAA